MGLLKQGKTGLLTGHVSRLAVVAMFGWAAVDYPVFAQTPPAPALPAPATPAAPTAVYTMTDLEYLLGPVALFPDPLLALVLQASTFPQQIVDADDWIVANPRAVEQDDLSAVDAKDWDASVKALTRFPDVIEMLADHLDWTQSLGMASALQPQDVATAVQLLRAKAESVGNLKSTPEQQVTVREDSGTRVIYIAPANPERIYVPIYDTSTVFFDPLPSALAFSTGILVGSAWNDRWGWHNRRWNQIWITPPVWHPPPPNWNPPRPGRPGVRPPGARPPGAWRPDRPGTRPERPPGVRPDRPGTRPDRPGARPDRPGVRPDRPGARPDRPGARPDRPGARPDRPGVRPDRPGARPDRPATRPDRPGARPDRPGARPDRPAARPDRPAARPERPAARPQRPAARPAERPAARPSRPAASRPAQRARPQQQQRARPQQARPQQQRARPQQQRARPQQQRARPQQARPQQQRARPQPQARPQQQRARPQQARPQQQQRTRPQGQRTPRTTPQ